MLLEEHQRLSLQLHICEMFNWQLVSKLVIPEYFTSANEFCGSKSLSTYPIKAWICKTKKIFIKFQLIYILIILLIFIHISLFFSNDIFGMTFLNTKFIEVLRYTQLRYYLPMRIFKVMKFKGDPPALFNEHQPLLKLRQTQKIKTR